MPGSKASWEMVQVVSSSWRWPSPPAATSNPIQPSAAPPRRHLGGSDPGNPRLSAGSPGWCICPRALWGQPPPRPSSREDGGPSTPRVWGNGNPAIAGSSPPPNNCRGTIPSSASAPTLPPSDGSLPHLALTRLRRASIRSRTAFLLSPTEPSRLLPAAGNEAAPLST